MNLMAAFEIRTRAAVLLVALVVGGTVWAQVPDAAGQSAASGANDLSNSGAGLGAAGAAPAALAGAGRAGMNATARTPTVTDADATANKTDVDALNRALSRARGNAKAEPPSQFQQFVQEATGKLLPNFGSQLFDAPQNYVPDGGLAVPSSYVVGPGDEIHLRVWGAVDFTSTLVVDRDGLVLIPKVGVVSVAGVAMGDLEPLLKSQLGHVYTNFNVNATLGRLRSIQVYVVGQARQPGTYAVSSLSTLISALFVSGGPNATGSMRAIALQRAGKTVAVLDLYDFIARGDKSHDAVLQPGDVIVIPPASQRVAVTGAYDQSAIYELKGSTTTVGDLLTLGGGASPVASARKALLERVDPVRVPPRQVQDLALDAKGLGQTLQGGDILTLLPVSPAFSNAVTLQGVVADPVRYRWFEGMRILDLIPDRDALITPDYYRRQNGLVQLPSEKDQDRAGKDMDRAGKEMDRAGKEMDRAGKDMDRAGKDQARNAGAAGVAARFTSMVDQVNWDYAVIERLNRDTLRTELIPFNLGRAVLQKDPSHNLPLQAGDVVTVLSQHDLALPQEKMARLVRLEGEVAAPGIYRAFPGETLPQLIQRVGGLTPQAYVFGIEFDRESVRRHQQDNLDTFVRKLEAQVQGRVTTVTPSSDAAAMALQQQQQAQQQLQVNAQIARLRSFKSNGRMALELDPQAQTLAMLPALPLEDGDHIVVPTTPGYVTAIGSVNNENAFIYKPGKTVGDVIRSAGLTAEADPDAVFVLRADGGVVSHHDHTSMFGRSFESLAVLPGDTLVVPAKVDMETSYNFTTRALKDWTQIIANFGLGIAAFKTLGL